MIDSSGFVGASNWNLTRQFVLNQALVLISEGISCSVIVYSTNATVLLNETECSNLTTLQDRLNTAPYLAGSSNLAIGLVYAEQVYQATNHSGTAVVVITNAPVAIEDDLKLASLALDQSGVSKVLLAVGPDVPIKELNELFYLEYNIPDFRSLFLEPYYSTASFDVLCLVPPIYTYWKVFVIPIVIAMLLLGIGSIYMAISAATSGAAAMNAPLAEGANAAFVGAVPGGLMGPAATMVDNPHYGSSIASASYMTVGDGAAYASTSRANLLTNARRSSFVDRVYDTVDEQAHSADASYLHEVASGFDTRVAAVSVPPAHVRPNAFSNAIYEFGDHNAYSTIAELK